MGNEQVELAFCEMIFVQEGEARDILGRERLTMLGIQNDH